MERAFRPSVVVAQCQEIRSRWAPPAGSNLRTRLRRLVRPADSTVPGVLSLELGFGSSNRRARLSSVP